MRIEVAKTLEGAMPDLAAARIIDETMKPRFRSQRLRRRPAARPPTSSIARINGEALPERRARGGDRRGRRPAASTGRTWASSCSSPCWWSARVLRGIFGASSARWRRRRAGVVAMVRHVEPRDRGAGRHRAPCSSRCCPAAIGLRGASAAGRRRLGRRFRRRRLGRRFGGGGGGGGGGFGSGGGGDFGGGGASGDW